MQARKRTPGAAIVSLTAGECPRGISLRCVKFTETLLIARFDLRDLALQARTARVWHPTSQTTESQLEVRGVMVSLFDLARSLRMRCKRKSYPTDETAADLQH